MKYGAKNIRKKAKQRLMILMSSFCVLLLVGNLIQASTIWGMVKNQPVHIEPVGINTPHTLTRNGLDANSLIAWSHSFLQMRFDVTPMNVDYSFDAFKTYLTPSYYNAISPTLDIESAYIKDNDMTSTLKITSVVPYPKYGKTLVKGVLLLSESNIPTENAEKAYLLEIVKSNGIVKLKNLKDISDEKEITL